MRLFDEICQIKHSPGLMQTKKLLGALFFAVALSTVAQTNPPSSTNTPTQREPAHTRQTRLLTLDECIKLAIEHNLDIQIQEVNPIVSQYALNVSYGVYEPVGNFTAQRSYFDNPGGVDPQGREVPATIRNGYSYTPEVKGSLPTGLTYDLNGPLTRSSLLNGTNPATWVTQPIITLNQPLLKNFWIDKNRLMIQLNKAALKISEAALDLQVMTSVTQVKTAYFNLLYGRDNVKANETAYKLAQQLVAENLKRVEVGTLAPLDEKQSESQAAASLATLQSAEFQLGGFENTLKNLITDHYSDWADVTIIPAEELMAVPQALDRQESWRKAVTTRPDLIEAKLKIEQQNVTLKYDFNQIFPELDVTGSYGRNANQDTFGNALDEIRQGSHSDFTYGGFVSVPLGGNYAGRNQYKSDKATLKQYLLQLKQTEQNILIAVDNDVGNIQSIMQQVNSTRDARIYAQEALDAERKKLENGKSTSFVVLQLITNLTTARVAEIQALANYNIAIAQLALDEGSTLEVNHIQLNVR